MRNNSVQLLFPKALDDPCAYFEKPKIESFALAYW